MNFIIILNYIKDTRAKPHGCLKLLNKCAIISISRLHLSKSQVLFALKFLRVQPCWSIFCQWRAGQKVLTHVLPVKVRKSWHTLHFCQWREESPKTPYTFATHSGCVNTHFDATDTSGSTPIWPHSCFHNYQTSVFNKKDEKQSWPSHNSFCATGRLEW